MATVRIALIEDNEHLAAGIAHRFRDLGHSVDILCDGEEGEAYLVSFGADVIILDINLPGISGLEILRTLRRRNDMTPVLMLTASGDTSDRVTGLDAGADDYLPKPFDLEELEARVRALARRRGQPITNTRSIGGVTFDFNSRVLVAGDTVIELRRQEVGIFECLLERQGTLVPKDTLIDQIYGVGADVDDKVVEVPISRLRRKLDPFGVRIKAARGLGYLMEPVD